MGMAIDQLGSSSLLSQLEQMNRQMNAMTQSATAFAVNKDGTQHQGLNAQAQFSADKSVNALSATNASVVNGSHTAATENATLANAGQSAGEFRQLLKDAFENVNVLQNESSSLQSRFDVGDRSVTLADVMIASQKSSLSFEATLQVRNKMVDAYQSIMQMQI